MNLSVLSEVMKEMGQPAFRLAQAKRAFYVEMLAGWHEVTPFSKALRDELEKRVPWDSLTPGRVLESSNKD
ncbi:MAG: hypothetical protein WC787_04960, partial [Patescibacteria group bacterium]